MIDPEFLAAQRRLFYAQDILTWVQLEQLAPAWWPNQIEMAEQLGIEPSTLSRALRRLEARDLSRRFCSKGGTFIWWVRRSAADRPDPSKAPHWVLRDVTHHAPPIKVFLGQEREWCERHEVPIYTLRSLLAGRMKNALRGRWRVARHPWECEEL